MGLTEAVAEELELIEVIAPAIDSPETGLSASPMDVIGSGTAEERKIVRIQDAFDLIPNVFAVPPGGDRASSFVVRGAGELTFHELTGGRTGVAFYVDDIPFTDSYGRDLALAGIESIAFFKGPHGTAFGAPGSMGVVDVTTSFPDEKWSGNVAQEFASHGFFRTMAATGGKIAEGLTLQIDGLYSRGDGWFTDRLTGDDYGKTETLGGRLRLRWTPSERLDVTFTAGLQRHDDDPAAYVLLKGRDPYTLTTDPHGYATGGQHYQALKAVWKADGWQLKSVTSHRRSDFDDSDGIMLVDVFNPAFLDRQREQDVRAWTQEIRAESTDPDAIWRWRGGLFFGHRDAFMDHFILGLGPWEGRNDPHYRQTDLALYGELTRKFGTQLEITAGLRLQSVWDDTRSGFEPTAFARSLGGVAFRMDRSGRFDAVLPSLAARWKWSDGQQSYARIAAGTQPGGFAVAAAGSRDYDTQDSLTYELGHEAAFLDGGLSLHTVLFYTDYRDYQSFQFNPMGQTIFNADSSHAWGAEIGLVYRPAESLEFSASAGWTRAEYDDFTVPFADYSGNRVENIPRLTGNVSASYRAEWGGVARLDWRYTGSIAFDQANVYRQGAYSTLDARIGYESERYGIYLFGRNLTGSEYYTHSYLFQGVPAATLGVPRIVGAEVRASF